ncbi:unnamed protein product [Adineta steineri]|uniref:Pentapeptide repeat-containing protein n=1 Tax=Adineta steineri TaxID=433720 RepID=A0A815HSI9_9BILA|nr:unnamed protein product [Adineta steineri]
MDNKKKKSGIQIFFDCAQLIIALFIPLAIIAYTVMQNNTEISIAQENRKQDLKIADERHEQEIILSTDEQEEAALVRYFDSLGKLLEKDMKLMNRTSIARFKTLTALAQLKSKRKGYLIRALIENKLITMNPGENLIIDLSLADLTGLDLSTNMLVKKEITCVNFNQTTLINASFRGLTLTASLAKSSWYKVKISYTSFFKADMTDINFIDSECHYCQFNQTQLKGANFRNSSLDGSDFSQANITYQQLIVARSLQNVILPNGTIFQSI